METLRDCAKSISPFDCGFRLCRPERTFDSKSNLSAERFGIPAGDVRREYCLIPAWCNAQEVDDRDSVFESLSEPTIVRVFRVFAHKGVVDGIVPVVDLLMYASLIVIPNPCSRAWKDGLDREKILHLLRLEDPPLRIHQRDSQAFEMKPRADLGFRENDVSFSQPADMKKCSLSQTSVSVEIGCHANALAKRNL
jgi:hypothetical protein